MATTKTPVRKTTAKTVAAPVTQKVTVKKTAPRKAAQAVVSKKVVVTQKPAAAPQAAKPVKPTKVKKPKMVRDSFTMPKDEYTVIDSLKVRSGKLGQAVKKSELLRAGIKALAAMSDIQFKAALSNVPTIKTGRPTNAK
jgi:hypothetical protein